MSAEIFADQYEWLCAQPNWRSIIHSSGLKGIKKTWTVQDCARLIKKQLPDHKLPFDQEGKSYALNIKLHKSLIKELNQRTESYFTYRRCVVSNPKYMCLRKPTEDIVEMPTQVPKINFLRDFINTCFKTVKPLNAKYTHKEIWNDNFTLMTWNCDAPLELSLWIDFLFNHIYIEITKFELELDEKLLKFKVKLPTMPTHICQEYFEMSSKMGLEKKCICCLDSDNMLLTTCGHVVCHGCFIHLRNQQEFKCPECRTIFNKE